jgi:lipid A 3-O-deacylase
MWRGAEAVRFSRCLPLFACACLAPLGVGAQDEPLDWFKSARAFSLFVENDAFASSDSSYSNGLRLTWDFGVWNSRLNTLHRIATLAPLLDRLVPQSFEVIRPQGCIPYGGRTSNRPCGSVSFGLGQTIYTPDSLRDPRLRPQDRPYAGHLFATVSLNSAFDKWQVSSELAMGVMGPAAQARETQSLAHWTWSPNSVKPLGWKHQLHDALILSLTNTYSFRAFEWCRAGCNGSADERRVFDVTPRVETVLGLHMTRASAGGTVRLGRRFPDLVGVQRIPTTADVGVADERGPRIWYALIGTFDARYVGHNAFLQGSYNDRGAGRWADVRQIALVRGVNEWTIGGAVGLRRASISASQISRSREYAPGGGRHRYWTIALSILTPRIS